MVQGKSIAKRAARAAYEKLGENIVALDVRKLATFCDYFLIVTGKNRAHLDALEHGIHESLKKAKVNSLRKEGIPGSGWVILDAGSVLIHIFHEREREFYNLRRLWADAVEVDLGDLSAPSRDSSKKQDEKKNGLASPKSNAPRTVNKKLKLTEK